MSKLSRIDATVTAAMEAETRQHADELAAYEAGWIISKVIKLNGKTQRVAFDSRTNAPLLAVTGQPLTWPAFAKRHSIRKQRDDKGSRHLRPGDSVNMTRRQVVAWENGEQFRYPQPLDPSSSYIRADSADLAPVIHPVPESAMGQNALLRALRSHLICNDAVFHRVVAGQRSLKAMRDNDHHTLCAETFARFWCGAAVEASDSLDTLTAQADKEGPAHVAALPPLTAESFMPAGLEVCARPAYVPLPAPAGYEWRPGQLEVHCGVMSNDDALAVLPTGYGKTLTFSAGMSWGANVGLQLVIVPTNVLKEDLVQRLRGMHPALAITYFGNGLKAEPLEYRLAGVVAGSYDVVIVSPEHLVPGNQVFAALMSANVGRIIIDEAHTLLTWGFRKSYPAMSHTLNNCFPDAQRCCFTATLERHRERALMRFVGARSDYLVYRGSVQRPNIQIDVVRQCCISHRAVTELVPQLEGRTVIMVNTLALADKYSELLGHRAKPYYSGGGRHVMTQRDKAKTLAWFRDTPDAILVATKAVGLGVDLEGVTNVIIAYVPESLLELVQMAGRAGRDGSPARCILLYTEAALKKAPVKLAGVYRTAFERWLLISQHL